MFDFSIFLTQNEGIIHGAIKRCGIFPQHQDYEDFLQQGRLSMWEAYQNYPNKQTILVTIGPFKNFLYQKVLWHLLDYLRKYYQKTPTTCAWPELDSQLEFVARDLTANQIHQLDQLLFLQKLAPILTQNERNYIIDTLFYELTPTEIAEKRQVDRRTVYYWREQISRKADDYRIIFEN